MPNYDEKNEISLYKFFEVLDEDIRQKSLSGELSKDQVEQYRVNQLAKQFMGTQFIYLYTPLGLPVSGEQKRLSTYGAQENEDYYKRQLEQLITTL